MTLNSATSDPLLAWRPEFPTLGRCTYLVSHSLGAMPRGVRDSLAAYADSWEVHGVRAWNEAWWELGLEIGNDIAELLNAPQGSVLMQLNASIANSVLFSALDFSDSQPRPRGHQRYGLPLRQLRAAALVAARRAGAHAALARWHRA